MPSRVLGLSAYYHDSAAALLVDGDVVAAAQEERFTRRKHDESFPENAVRYCLAHAGCALDDLDAVVFYEKPLLKFERLLETYIGFAPRGLRSFLSAMPVWLHDKLFMKRSIRDALRPLARDGRTVPQLLFTEHHEAHAASAFFPSPFERAAVLCMDGVGEWATTSVWLGEGNTLAPRWQIDFPHSLGLLYSAFTYFTGFKVNSGEYKLMGLAPYGEPKYVDTIRENLIDLRDDGTFALDMDYFDFATGLTMTSARFAKLFGWEARKPDAPLTQREMDLARSVQEVIDEAVVRLARTVKRELDVDALCMAGGVALNCVANGKLRRAGIFRDVWVQPASGDAGGALGAAYVGAHHFRGEKRTVRTPDAMHGARLGPSFTQGEVRAALDAAGAVYTVLDEPALLAETARLLASENVVGWVQGRMEFGPRALGSRSILGDPRSAKMQSVMNLKIKFRESFRPFAPAVLEERAREWFDLDGPSPYMLFVAPVHERIRVPTEPGVHPEGLARLATVRSLLPAITHVDHSARVQTVSRTDDPRFHALLTAFEALTGCPVLVNTSFNVRGEPIVCTPADAWRCFMGTGMDALVVGDCLVLRRDQRDASVATHATGFAAD